MEYTTGTKIKFDRRFKALTESGSYKRTKPSTGKRITKVVMELDATSKFGLLLLAAIIIFMIVG
jgi:hypothetical protein